MAEAPKLRVGWVGFGSMGGPMSANLHTFLSSNAYPPLSVWNRTSSKLPPASSTLIHASSPQELASTCDVVFTSLASDEVAKEVYEQLWEGARKKGPMKKDGAEPGQEEYLDRRIIFCETSTLHPDTSGELERKTSQIKGSFYLQTPVFGPPPLASTAQLVFVLSGDHFAKQKIAPLVVPSMGRKVIDVGSNVERAASFKLNGNMMILGVIEIIAEAYTLAEKTGVGAELMDQFVNEFMPAPSMIGYGKKIKTNDFASSSGFTVLGGLKDARHIRTMAASAGTVVPVIDTAYAHLITSKANGGSELDWSSLVCGPRLAAGLTPWEGAQKPERGGNFRFEKEDEGVTKPVKSGPIVTVSN